LQERNSLLTS